GSSSLTGGLYRVGRRKRATIARLREITYHPEAGSRAGAGGGGCNEVYADYGRPETNGGTPCIRGLRIPVATVVGMVADGMAETDDEILERDGNEARIVVSADTDFGALLALRRERKPSVVIFRQERGRHPEQ